VSVGQPFQFPKELEGDRRRIERLAWLSILGLGSAAVALGLTLGQSQTMKTAWVGDMLAIIPPIGSLVAMRYGFRPATARFPYGYFRAISVAFLVAASVLSLIGLWLLFDAIMKLLRQEHPSIGTMELFGRQIWAGWPMVAALAYSSIIGFTLGTLKRPVARKLHDKALEADADSNKADWMSEAAGIAGIVAVGFGYWWGDAVAAGLISLAIVYDGWINLRQVVADLMDETPTELGSHNEHEALPRKIKDAAERLDWVEKAAVRLREHGRVLTGEVFVVPRVATDLVTRAEEGAAELQKLDWRLHDLTVTPVSKLDEEAPPRARELRAAN
jgi:cation diffusion facilitator family transporter